MQRYIDADKLMSELVNEDWGGEISFSSVDDIVEKLRKEAGDVAPIVHAHFYNVFDGEGHCSHCEGLSSLKNAYCPHCGAKMDE